MVGKNDSIKNKNMDQSNNNISIMPLGGQNERGSNLLCLKINDQIFVLETGGKPVKTKSLGIAFEVPDFNYLKEQQAKIKGIFISAPQNKFLSGLVTFLSDIKKPIFTSELGQRWIKNFFYQTKKMNFLPLVKVLTPETPVSFGATEVQAFATVSEMPESQGFAFVTNHEAIVYTGDFIFDQREHTGFNMNLKQWNNIAQNNKVVALITNCDNADHFGYTAPQHLITRLPKIKFINFKQRTFLICRNDDLIKIKDFINLFASHHRYLNVVVDDNSMFHILKYLKFGAQTFKNVFFHQKEDQKRSPLVIICGDQKSIQQKVAKIALEQDKFLFFKTNDHIILANPPTPGEEVSYGQTQDEIARCQCKITVLNNKEITKANASFEDMIMAIKIFCPRYFIPVGGLYIHMLQAQKAAYAAGMTRQHVLIIKNGEFYAWKDNEFTCIKKIKVVPKQIENICSREQSPVVLKERKKISEFGALTVCFAINQETKNLCSDIIIEMRGLFAAAKNKDVIIAIKKIIANMAQMWVDEYRQTKIFVLKDQTNHIREKIKVLIATQFKKWPIIIVVINEI